MNCNEYENLITDYLESTASPSQRIQMELHLSGCEKCRTLSAQEKSVMEQLRTIPIEPCPDEIVVHVMESISGPVMPLKERIRLWLKPGRPMRYGVASLAGSFAIVMLLLFLYTPGRQRQTMEGNIFSPEEIRQATVEVKLALAYFEVYSRKTESALKKIDFIEPVINPIEAEFKKALGKVPYI